ncbi:hypothetical protein HZ996_11610 [Cryomorphaceae bacterium]|nr:hypothetical protein HZ996_11610 [Cryomorphaceae bacterium]
MKRIGLKMWVLSLLLISSEVVGQENTDDKFTEIKANLLFGLNQPLLGGFNIEGNLFYHRLAFDYSHGVSLNLDNEYLDEENQLTGIDVHIPWTTGFGVGYRFNDWFNLRAEPKWHKFELYHMDEAQIEDNLIDSYTTFTFGIGAYANIQPFKRQNNFLKGFMIAPSIRWWPRVSSSLENDELEFYSKALEQNVTHEALQVGISNTPLIVNISIGYSFGWEKESKAQRLN